MSLWDTVAGLVGGVGLFLLGMGLMTDGLKLAAGPTLERVLARSTESRWRGLTFGALMTALVQSSSAITVAAIGFVNAGLLSLGQALWVLFGANVGTTMTGWLVALVGMKFQIDALALPMIGLGMLLRLIGAGDKRGAFGMAMAGFGVLFLGIDLLKDAFSGFAAGFTLPHLPGMLGILVMVLVGVLMAVLMQASAAALVLAFSAAQSGMVTLEAAAAVVIGANVGTTITAILAALAATPNGKRAAGAHVLFNALTGVVALLILPGLLAAIIWLREALELDASPAATLALFHTVFNLLGVALMWPLADALTEFLLRRFHTAEEDEARPRYLDANVGEVPVLALDALEREIRRMGEIALRMLDAAFTGDEARRSGVERDRVIVERLNFAVGEFIARLHRASMSADSARKLPRLLRIARYYEALAELAGEAAQVTLDDAIPPNVQLATERLRAEAESLLAVAASWPGGVTALDAHLAEFERLYQVLKAELLEAGTQGLLPVLAMDGRLRVASALRRAMRQGVKAARLLAVREEAQGLAQFAEREGDAEPPPVTPVASPLHEVPQDKPVPPVAAPTPSRPD